MALKVDKKPWGMIQDTEVETIKISAGTKKAEIILTNYGARIVSVKMPDKQGKIAETTLGFKNVDDYVAKNSYYGCTTGRVANRIANAQFELDGKKYQLAANNLDKHTLHGGIKGFDKRIWEITEVAMEGDVVKVIFTYTSLDGEEGFPGTLKTRVTYLITERSIEIDYTATSDKPTIVNLTNHTYWNLAGTDAKIYDHQVKLAASKYVVTDAELIPTGEIRSVEGTGLDFRELKALGGPLKQLGWIDHNYVLDKGSKMGSAAQVYCPATGRELVIETDQPAIIFYTGNFLEGHKAWGKPCVKHQALCLETQKPADAIHHANFPSIVLRPGETYRHVTRHIFKSGEPSMWDDENNCSCG
jgi:aldose 1-epimerase